MEHSQALPAERLVPHRGRMRLIEFIKAPTWSGLHAEATISEAWPLSGNGSVSSIICVELVAQAISALSTWRRGEGARPQIGLLVGIKEVELYHASIPVRTKLVIQVEEINQLGGYAVFKGKVKSDSASFCEVIVQVLEPEKEDLSSIIELQRLTPARKKMEDCDD